MRPRSRTIPLSRSRCSAPPATDAGDRIADAFASGRSQAVLRPSRSGWRPPCGRKSASRRRLAPNSTTCGRPGSGPPWFVRSRLAGLLVLVSVGSATATATAPAWLVASGAITPVVPTVLSNRDGGGIDSSSSSLVFACSRPLRRRPGTSCRVLHSRRAVGCSQTKGSLDRDSSVDQKMRSRAILARERTR